MDSDTILSPFLPFANQPILFWLQRRANLRVYRPLGPVRPGEDVTGKVWARISAKTTRLTKQISGPHHRTNIIPLYACALLIWRRRHAVRRYGVRSIQRPEPRAAIMIQQRS